MNALHVRSRKFLVAALLVVLFGTYLRIFAMEKTRIDAPIRGDAKVYVTCALNLQRFGVFSSQVPTSAQQPPPPDAFVTPGYPLFLSLLLDASRMESSVVRVGYVQAVLGVAVLMVYLPLFRRFLSAPLALIATFLTAISPHLVNSSVYLLTETLFTLMLGLFLLGLDFAQRTDRPWLFIVSGVLLGATTLVRPTTLLFIFPLALWLHWTPGTAAVRMRRLALIILPFALIQGAWMIRNVHETGHTSDPTLFASFIQHGGYINLEYDDKPESYGYPYRFDPDNDRIHGNPALILQSLLERAEKAPWRYLEWFLIGKPVQYLSWNLTESVGDGFIYAPAQTPYADQPIFIASHVFARLTHWPLAVLALGASILAMLRRSTDATATLFALCLLYFIGFHMIGAPFPRYSIPVRPVLYGLAMLCVQALWLALSALLVPPKRREGSNLR